MKRIVRVGLWWTVASVTLTGLWAWWQSRYRPEDEAEMADLHYRFRNGYPLPGPASYPTPNDAPLVR
jgi:hypothetical protein